MGKLPTKEGVWAYIGDEGGSGGSSDSNKQVIYKKRSVRFY